MDFRTYPISREIIRQIAKEIRKLFKCTDNYYFDVINAIELVPIYFPNVTVEIVSDKDQELKNVPSTTIPDMRGNYCIKIKESIYEGAYLNNVGGYRNHIMHEISHVILFMLGYTPYFDRTYKNNELNPFESIERQAKALAGEVLIPFEATENLTIEEIIEKCKVSKDAAIKRIKIRK